MALAGSVPNHLRTTNIQNNWCREYKHTHKQPFNSSRDKTPSKRGQFYLVLDRGERSIRSKCKFFVIFAEGIFLFLPLHMFVRVLCHTHGLDSAVKVFRLPCFIHYPFTFVHERLLAMKIPPLQQLLRSTLSSAVAPSNPLVCRTKPLRGNEGHVICCRYDNSSLNTRKVSGLVEVVRLPRARCYWPNRLPTPPPSIDRLSLASCTWLAVTLNCIRE